MNALVMVFGLGLAVTIRAQFADKCEIPVQLVHDYALLVNKTEQNVKCVRNSVYHSLPIKRCENEQGSWINCLDGVNHWMKCGYPDYPSNGYIYITRAMQLSYACNQNFILLGVRERLCSTQGTWFPIIPKCVKNLAKDSGYQQLTDGNLSTYVNLKENDLTQLDLKKEVIFDGVSCNNANTVH